MGKFGWGGRLAPWAAVAWWFGLATAVAAQELRRYQFSHRQMGTVFQIVLYASTPHQAQAAAQSAFERIDQLNSILSDYDPQSELSRLSATSGTGRWVRVSEDLWRVLSFSQRLACRSEGAFDVTVGPLVRLWRRARRQHRLPKPQRLQQALQATGYRWLRLDPGTKRVLLMRSGMRLDLGGVAKGYAVQQALEVLRRRGIRHALVDGGGDLALGDPPPGRRAWRVQLPPVDPRRPKPPQFLHLAQVAVATSGDAYQHVLIDGKRYSHIVDPRTGLGLTNQSTVTVIAPQGMQADALATAVSVLGPQRGFELLRCYPGTAARVVMLQEGKPRVFYFRWPQVPQGSCQQ